MILLTNIPLNDEESALVTVRSCVQGDGVMVNNLKTDSTLKYHGSEIR